MDKSLQNYFISTSSVTQAENEMKSSELETKVSRLTDKVTNTINSVVNEPSVALYRIDENVRKNVPILYEQQKEFRKMKNMIQGAQFDMEYEMSAIRNIAASKEPLRKMYEAMKETIFLKQQLDYNILHRQQRPAAATVASAAVATSAAEASAPTSASDVRRVSSNVSDAEEATEERAVSAIA